MLCVSYFGHKASNCHLKDYKTDPRVNYSVESDKVWKKKENKKCGLVLSVQRKKGPWYIDSGCSKHMTSDKSKFLSLSENKSRNVHMDLCGPSIKEGTRGERYFMLFIDDYSRLTWVSFLKEKSKALEKFKIFKALIENQIGKRLKAVRYDRGGELCSG